MLMAIVLTTVYLLILLNPLSKVFFLTSLGGAASPADIRRLSVQATCIALGILIVFAGGGVWLLDSVLRVKLYSLQIAGGLILFVVGYRALTTGIFFEMDHRQKLWEMSIVPVASPMLAGPASITAVIHVAYTDGFLHAVICITAALLLNLLVMLAAPALNRLLGKHNILGALVRITGLMIATMGVQMVLDGLDFWRRL
jgi:multiple antibiotic resistance protein